ncbi:hypothetical protein L917_01942, partial [Phytophthora nicotianae]
PQSQTSTEAAQEIRTSTYASGKKTRTLAAIKLPDKKVPVLTRVLELVYNTSDVEHVREVLTNYPVIMTDDSMEARATRSRRSYVHSEEFDNNFVVPDHLVTK